MMTMSSEAFRIEKGKLGPLNVTEKEMEIRPLTVFVGEQGAGKSLCSQLLYFFRNLSYLSRFYDAQLGREASVEMLVRVALNDLRSNHRVAAVFADPMATVSYTTVSDEQIERTYKIGLNYASRRTQPYQHLIEEIARLRENKTILSLREQALFAPAERILYSQARGPSTWDLLALPTTLKLFASTMEYAGDTFNQWIDGTPDTPQGKWIREKGQQALRGEAVRRGDNWLWQFEGDKKIDIDMASAGQKANWPLVILGEALFSWRREGLIDTPYYLHIEEPETHLHPAAQIAMVELLAYLVNQGVNIVITTHSLVVLYTLNNLMWAYRKLGMEDGAERVPKSECRLSPQKVAAYMFRNGSIEDIMDSESGQIDESQLGKVLGDLEIQFNRIATYGILWGESNTK